MKKQSYLLALGTLLSGAALAQSAAPAMKAFSVAGTVRSAQPGSMVYLETGMEPARRVDSTRLGADNRFALQSQIPDGGGLMILNIGGAQRIGLLLEGGETLNVVADGYRTDPKTGQPGKAQVTGSKNMEYYQKLIGMKTEMDGRAKAWQQRYEEATKKKDQKAIQQIEKEYDTAEREFVGKVKTMLPDMGTSLVALFATNFLSVDNDFATMDSLARRFERENPNSPQAKSFIGTMARIRGLAVGGTAPDIALNDTTGNVVPLSSLRGKVVLIDFWASWCGPCRMENPNVVRVYNKFKDKGFAIYGVSLDQNRDSWLKAIRNDKLTWTQVSDLRYWNSVAAQQYGVSAIPATFLLDKDGKIIAKNLRGEALERKLEEVLK